MRIASIGHAVFAVSMIVLVGLLHPDFIPLWNPVPASVSARELLVNLGALISIASGVGLLVQRMAASAARLLLITLFLRCCYSGYQFSSPTRFRSLLVSISARSHPGSRLGALCLVCH